MSNWMSQQVLDRESVKKSKNHKMRKIRESLFTFCVLSIDLLSFQFDEFFFDVIFQNLLGHPVFSVPAHFYQLGN